MILPILALGALLRLISLNQSLWFDEGINIMAAKSYTFWGMITQYAVADFHPPLWFGILWIWGKLFGYSEAMARAPSVIFGVATVYITYLIGKKLISKKVGLLGALLLSVNPLHIYYSQEARMYSLSVLAVSINILLFVKLIKREKVNTVFLTLSNFFILVSDYIAYFIFPAEVLFLVFKRRDLLKKWFLALFAAIILNSLWWPLFLKQLDTGAVASSKLPTWKFVAGGFDIKSLPLTFVKFIIGRISLANKTLYAALLIPLSALFTYLILKGLKYTKGFSRYFLFLWLIIPPVLAGAVSFAIPIYNYFRVLYVVPAFTLTIAAGFLSLKKFRNIFLVSVILIEVTCSLLYLLIPQNQREDWKGLSGFFKRSDPQALILLESSGTFPVFDYYAKNSLNVKGALRDFPAYEQTSVADLEAVISQRRDFYLIDYMVQISDPQRLVAQSLDELGYKVAEIKDFHGVGFVYHYVK